VIGAGPVGENVAARAVRGGLSAVIVESELVGGECSYWACMPSKALLRSPQALADARTVDGARQAVTGTLDTAAVLARRDAFASHWQDDGQVRWRGDAIDTGDRERRPGGRAPRRRRPSAPGDVRRHPEAPVELTRATRS
jgi:pyruvate/2-oxoglutarate dehydrogenase complex dihydrolipoamide dehydrogenase (E3) component